MGSPAAIVNSSTTLKVEELGMVGFLNLMGAAGRKQDTVAVKVADADPQQRDKPSNDQPAFPQPKV
jgi:hypothetical protein